MILLSLCWYCIFQAFVLLIAANGAPVIITKLLGNRLARPIDNGLVLGDGYRLFGNSKTWRGLFSALVFCAAAAILLGLQPVTGILFGALTMIGDLLTSFIKRRLGNVESSRAIALDTVLESLTDVALIAVLFFLCEEFVSPVLYRLNIRNQPY